MSDGEVRGPKEKVIPVHALREWARARGPLASGASNDNAAPPASLAEAAERLAEMRGPIGEPGMNRWGDPMVMPQANIAAIGGDCRTRFVTGADDELAAGRASQAQERYFAGLDDLKGFVNDAYGLLIKHCAYMCGMQRREDRLHSAYFKGDLSLKFFRRNITESPFEEALIARLDVLQEGFYSDDPVTRRDTIALSCEIVTGLWYAAEDGRVAAHASFAHAAAADFLDTAFEPEDVTKVDKALAAMAKAVPATRLAPVARNVVRGAETFVGRARPITPAAVFPLRH